MNMEEKKKTQFSNATLLFYPRDDPRRRLAALWYFTALLSAWILFFGHTVLGFEQSWAHPAVAVSTAIAVQMLLEWVDARARCRPLRFAGGLANFLNFLPPAIIPGLALSMLLFPGESVWPLAFAAAFAMASKVLFRAPVAPGVTQHVFNPSNLAVAVTLVLFSSTVGLTPPYQFTENISGLWDWGVPVFVLVSGIAMHGLFTGRFPLVAAWLVGFVLQGQLRAWMFDIPWMVPILPMTSAAFIIFTLYMIPDPATTPIKPRQQMLFGLAVAAVYGALQALHVVFGLFFALVLVCAARGLLLYLAAARQGTPAPAAA
jgi:Na+-translocating ferredoxin:NAD+ oxidoreductase RnfD subunit